MRTVFSVQSLFLSFFLGFLWVQFAHAQPVFINEIHYDNLSADQEEGVELAGPAGTDLAGWELVFYNGGNGSPYLSKPLEGLIGDQSNGFGVLAFAIPGIQNGAPDGIALVNALSEVLQFLSYEGSFVVATGIAAGLASLDIEVSESAATAPGLSLQLIGTGEGSSDFFWGEAQSSSFGAINNGQEFRAVGAGELPVSGTLWLILWAAGSWLTCSRLRMRKASSPGICRQGVKALFMGGIHTRCRCC